MSGRDVSQIVGSSATGLAAVITAIRSPARDLNPRVVDALPALDPAQINAAGGVNPFGVNAETPWGKIAIGGGLALVLVGGIAYVISTKNRQAAAFVRAPAPVAVSA